MEMKAALDLIDAFCQELYLKFHIQANLPEDGGPHLEGRFHANADFLHSQELSKFAEESGFRLSILLQKEDGCWDPTFIFYPLG